MAESCFIEARVQAADFDVGQEFAALRAGRPGIGAVASFVGLVRDVNDSRKVGRLTLEHYPGMTERSLREICEQAAHRWPSLQAITVIHRVGCLEPLDQIVLVAVGCAHRGDAFQSCEFLMDYLKTQAPFWKKEATPDGDRWVATREADEGAARRWDSDT